MKNLIQSALRAAAFQKSMDSLCFPENTVSTIEAAKTTAVVNITRNIKKDEAKWHWRLVQASVLSAGTLGQCSDAPFKISVLFASEIGLAADSG